jgi:hypothetical protein
MYGFDHIVAFNFQEIVLDHEVSRLLLHLRELNHKFLAHLILLGSLLMELNHAFLFPLKHIDHDFPLGLIYTLKKSYSNLYGANPVIES